jgi:hypothetical protein
MVFTIAAVGVSANKVVGIIVGGVTAGVAIVTVTAYKRGQAANKTESDQLVKDANERERLARDELAEV